MTNLNWRPVNVATINDLDNDAQLRMGAYIIQKYEDWRQLRRGYEDVWKEIDRQINQYDPIHTPILKIEQGITIDSPDLMGSKLKMSNTYAHREGIVAAILKYLLMKDYDFFDIVPLDPMDDEACMAVKEYLMYLFDVMDFEKEFVPFLRDIVQYGTAIASYEWETETATRWKTEEILDPETKVATGNIRYKADEIIYDAPRFRPLNVYRCVIDPTAKDVKTATLIFQKMITPHEMLANPAYANITEADVFGAPDAGPDTDSVAETEREIARRNDMYSSDLAYKGKKKIYEAWGDFTDGEVLYQNYVAEVFNGRLIRFEPNPYLMPYKPFIIARYTTETGRIYGPSPLASITAIQSGYDTIINQVIDANAMHNERPILMLNGTLVTDKQNKDRLPPLGKNSVWRVRDLAGIERMKDDSFEGVAASMAILPILENQMKLATGDNELISGGPTQPYVTTGQVVTVAEAGNSRFNMYAKTIEQEAIVTMLEMTVDLLRQRNMDPVTLKTTDPAATQPEVTFDPLILLNRVKFNMRGASYNATRQLQISAMQQFYTMLTQNPATLQIMNWIRVVIDFGEALGIRSVRSQILPQAMAQLQQMPETQGPWYMNVMKLFGQQSQKAIGEQTVGQQLATATAPAFGGNNSTSTAPSPFNVGGSSGT